MIKLKSERKYNKLAIIKDYDIIGLDDSIINNNYSFTVECTSNTAEYYRIHINVRFIKTVPYLSI